MNVLDVPMTRLALFIAKIVSKKKQKFTKFHENRNHPQAEECENKTNLESKNLGFILNIFVFIDESKITIGV